MGMVIRDDTVCYILLCFIQAHLETRDNFQSLLEGDDGGEDADIEARAEQKVLQEIDSAIYEAKKELQQIDARQVQKVKMAQVINVVLESERKFIVQLVEEGALQEKEGHELLHHMIEEEHQNARLPPSTSTFLRAGAKSISASVELPERQRHNSGQSGGTKRSSLFSNRDV